MKAIAKEAIRAVIFDLDGTLYRGKKAIEGAAECIAKLRKAGIMIFFLSNAGTNKREEMARKLIAMGIDAKPEEVYSSAYGAARYIRERYGKGSRFYAIAEKSMIEELEGFGLYFDDEKPDAVVVSLDRNANYGKIAKAYLLVKSGAEFIATNKDPDYPVENGSMPGAGAIVAAVEASVQKKPTLIGKPETRLIDWMLHDRKLKKSEVLLVGDSLITDVAVAKKSGIKSALVLSGITTEKQIKKTRIKPDAVLRSVKELPRMLL